MKMLGVRELCEELDLSDSTIRRYIKMGMPFVRGKSAKAGHRFDVAKCSRWMADNKLTGDVGARPEELNEELKRETLRKVKAQADKYEQELKTAIMEYDKARGELMSRAEVEEGRVKRIQFVKNGLLGLPAAISPQLEGLRAQEIQTKIDGEVRRLLEFFSRQ